MYLCELSYVYRLFSLEFCYFVAAQHSICRQAQEHAVTAADLYHGLKAVQPSAMKELAIEKPNVSYNVRLLFDFNSRQVICLFITNY